MNNSNRLTPLSPLPSRREMLQMSGLGFGSIALSYLLNADGLSGAPNQSEANLEPKPGHFPGKAKAVIQIVQNGGPSQMDLFDPKPELQKHDGQRHTEKVEMFQTGSEANELMASPFEFQKHGECGMELSEALTHTSKYANDICLVRSMHTGHNNHTEGLIMYVTGKIFPGRPAIGCWVSYGLGTENQNLPAFIVLRDPAGYNTSGNLLWNNGWMPATYRGTEFSTEGSPVLNLNPIVPQETQRENLELLAKLNEEHRTKYPHDSELHARILNYELAARMQLAAGDVLDIGKESDATKKMYGMDNPVTAGYATRCLMARRLVEAGVRFVQIFPPAKYSTQPWDSHLNTRTEIDKICRQTELPVHGLIHDLKSRGLLDSTIVWWGGEFGRLPVSQNGSGRDHNRNAFSLWLAGGGFKGGHIHGATDDFGYRAVQDRVGVSDLHATILHQLGLDHSRLTYQHHGRDETLTDIPLTGAKVVGNLIDGPLSA